MPTWRRYGCINLLYASDAGASQASFRAIPWPPPPSRDQGWQAAQQFSAPQNAAEKSRATDPGCHFI